MAMTTPALVEYLSAVRREGVQGRGSTSPLVGRGVQPTAVPYFPPLTSVPFSSEPVGYWAAIGFHLSFGRMPANVFFAEIVQYGQQTYGGVLVDDVIREGLAGYMLVTAAQPAYYRVLNTDTIAHRFEIITHYLTIATPDDLNIVQAIVRRHRQSDDDEVLLDKMLKTLDGQPVPASPSPPRAGGILIGGRR